MGKYDILADRMRRQIFVLLFFVAAVVGLAYAGTKLFLKFKSGKAGLKINSNPQAAVFINDEFKSNTPFDEKLSSGEYKIKLNPEGTGTDTSSWEQNISISSGLYTYINRELGPNELESAGEILTLEPIESEKSEISVISTPDGASVALDGQEKGTSPLVISSLEPGEHNLFVYAPGFNGREIKVKTAKGFKLNADVQLSLVPGEKQATDEADIKDDESKDKGNKVKILDTPTGWLRVRQEPSLSATESAKVNPGDTFVLLDEKEGWFKIEYKDQESGWISSRYAEKEEE